MSGEAEETTRTRVMSAKFLALKVYFFKKILYSVYSSRSI